MRSKAIEDAARECLDNTKESHNFTGVPTQALDALRAALSQPAEAEAEEVTPGKLLENVAICLQGWAMRHDIKPELAESMIARIGEVDRANVAFATEREQLRTENERLRRQLAEAGKAWHGLAPNLPRQFDADTYKQLLDKLPKPE